MVVRRVARWSPGIAVLFAVFAAVAQTNSPAPGASSGSKFRAACGEDSQQFCAAVQPGGGRLVQCLSSHASELSAAYGNVIAAAGGGSKLRAACGEDLQQFCAAVQPGRGRLVQCLSSHASELSAACGNVIAAGGGGSKLRAACGEDLQRFCAAVQPGRGPLVQCLSSHASELSVACGNMIATIQTRKDATNPSEQSPATQSAAPVTVGNSLATLGSILRASCGPDVQRLCAAARRESEVLRCLDSQRMELSTTCSLYFQKLGARPSAQENAPSKKPPAPPPTAPIPAHEIGPPPSLPPVTPMPAQENAPPPSPPSTTSMPAENAPNKKPPPAAPVPFPD